MVLCNAVPGAAEGVWLQGRFQHNVVFAVVVFDVAVCCCFCFLLFFWGVRVHVCVMFVCSLLECCYLVFSVLCFEAFLCSVCFFFIKTLAFLTGRTLTALRLWLLACSANAKVIYSHRFVVSACVD